MSKFEDQIERIGHKAKLREVIERLDDDHQALILTWSNAETEDQVYKFHVYGGATVAEAVYACETFKSFMVNG